MRITKQRQVSTAPPGALAMVSVRCVPAARCGVACLQPTTSLFPSMYAQMMSAPSSPPQTCSSYPAPEDEDPVLLLVPKRSKAVSPPCAVSLGGTDADGCGCRVHRQSVHHDCSTAEHGQFGALAGRDWDRPQTPQARRLRQLYSDTTLDTQSRRCGATVRCGASSHLPVNMFVVASSF